MWEGKMIQQTGVPWGQRSRGDLSSGACLFLMVQLTRAASSLFLSPTAAAAARQRLVQEAQVMEYAGSVPHFHKLKIKWNNLLCSAFCSSDCMSWEAARVNENNTAGNLVDIGLEWECFLVLFLNTGKMKSQPLIPLRFRDKTIKKAGS